MALIERVERSSPSHDTRPRLLVQAGGRMKMVDIADVEVVEADRQKLHYSVCGKGVPACLLHAAASGGHHAIAAADVVFPARVS